MAEQKKKSEKKIETKSERGQYTKERRAIDDYKFQKENAAACKYKEEYADEIIEYFSKPDFEVKQMPDGKTVCVPSDFPTFEQFAADHHVTMETVVNWTKRSARFKDCYARAHDLQKARLVRNSLADRYNAQFAKFYASACMGMTEKTAHEIDASDGINVKIKVVE